MKIIFCYLIFYGIVSFSMQGNNFIEFNKTAKSARTETFKFFSNGKSYNAKIHLPAAYNSVKNLPAIFLIDFTEQHFKLATDEFEKVIDGVQKTPGLNALVVSLQGIPDIDAEPQEFQKHYEIYRDMAIYVDGKYTNNSSRTFIGKGSESGVVLMALLLENPETSVFDNFIATDPSGLYGSAIIKLLENKDFPKNKSSKKLHFSFSTSNDRVKCKKIIDLINKAQLPGLEFESKEYTNSDYENTYPVSFPEGIRFLFNK